MFTINDDLSIYATRGDTVFFTVTADENGTPYTFQAGDVLRIKIYEKKNAENVVLEKCFPVTAATTDFTVLLTEEDTKIGEVISKAKDCWYEIELNPFTNPQTIIGYDEDGAKVFKLFPEGADSEIPEVNPEDIPVVDVELDMTSNRPVQNQAISRAIVNLEAAYQVTKKEVSEFEVSTSESVKVMQGEIATERARIDNFVSLKEGSTTGDAELIDSRTSENGSTFSNSGNASRASFRNIHDILRKAGVGESINLTIIPNYYVDRDGIIRDNESFCYSEPVSIKRGQSVRLFARGYENRVAMVSVLNDGTYTPVAISNNNEMSVYEYTADKDCELVFSFTNNRGYTLNVTGENIAVVSNAKVLLENGYYMNPTLSLIEDKYIDAWGNLVEYEGYSMSLPVQVSAGYSVLFNAYGYSNNVAIMYVENLNDGSHHIVRSRVNEAGQSAIQTYKYTATEDVKITFSFATASGYGLDIFYDAMAADQMKNIDMVDLAVFPRFGVVGDSYASGTLGETMHYNTSWGSIMARIHGTECIHFSTGGLTTQTWQTNSKGLSLLNKTEPCDIYYLALGINDSNRLGADYLGTVADIHIDKSELNADTFCGNYGKIISAIKSHAPQAKIVLFTLRENSEVRKSYNDTIIEIAKHIGIPYIIQDSDPFFTSTFYNDTMKSGHPIAITYSGMAKGYERLLKKCIVSNTQYFSNLFED